MTAGMVSMLGGGFVGLVILASSPYASELLVPGGDDTSQKAEERFVSKTKFYIRCLREK